MKIIKWIKKHLRLERVLFADLDGTIIVTKSGKTFPENCDDWQFKKYIIEAIKEYNPTHLHIVSNQGGIEKGFVDEREFIRKMLTIREELKRLLPKTRITYDFCSSNDPKHPYRKPNDGMIDFYCTDTYNNTDCDKRNCLMIGDTSGKPGQFSDSDKKCAENAGIKYMDVEDFIVEFVPCAICDKLNLPCRAGEDYPMLPCK
ncbi:MAG: HAD-IIIA family hydrolase [Prevotella sp.]|nr:HAD-IIIA family hydrolase [Candidatus Prevotella equi]